MKLTEIHDHEPLIFPILQNLLKKPNTHILVKVSSHNGELGSIEHLPTLERFLLNYTRPNSEFIDFAQMDTLTANRLKLKRVATPPGYADDQEFWELSLEAARNLG